MSNLLNAPFLPGHTSAQTQLVRLVLVVALPALVALGWSVVQEQQADHQQAVSTLTQARDNVVRNLNAFLNDKEARLSRLAARPRVRAMDSRNCDPLVQDSLDLHPDFANLVLLDSQGNTLCAARPNAMHALPAKEENWFSRAVNAQGFQVAIATPAVAAAPPTALLSYPVHNDAGQLRGLVVLPLNLEQFRTPMLDGVSPQAQVTLSDPLGQVLLQSHPASDVPIASADLQTSARTRTGAWQVVVSMPQQAAPAQSSRTLYYTLWMGLAGLALALVLAWRMGLRLLSQLHAPQAARSETLADPDPPGTVPTGLVHTQTLEQREQEHERLQLILRSLDEAPWDINLLTREVYFSPRWWQMLGYEEDELSPSFSLWKRLRHPADVQRLNTYSQSVFDSGATSFQMEYRLRHKQGHYVPVRSRGYVLRNAQGQPVRLSGTNRDLTEYRRAERLLQESQDRYRALVEWSPIGIGVHQHGRVVYVNPAALDILGAHSPDALIGTAILERVHPDDRQKVIARVQHSLATNEPMPRREERFLRMDGTVVDIEIQGTVTTHLGEPAMHVNFLDITERKRAEATLRESETRFRALTDLSFDWYWEQDEHLRFVHVGDQFHRTSRIKPMDYMGLLRWETPHAGVSEARWAEHRATLDARAVFRDFEMQHPGHHGGWVWVSISGIPIFDDSGVFKGYWGVGRDISQRRRAEHTLRESQAQYQELVEWSPVGLAVYQNKRLVYVNPAATRMLGAANSDELVGTQFEARIHLQCRTPMLERLKAVVKDGVHAPLCESNFLRLDGQSLHVETQSMPIVYRGSPAVLISFQDISARKQIENTLRESEERFRTLTRLSSDWYWEQDENFRFVMLSGNIAQSTGLSIQAHIGKTRWELPSLNLGEADWDRHRATLHSHQEYRDFEIRRPDSAGRSYWASVSGTPVFDGHGVFRGYRGIGRDITLQKNATEQIHRLAFYDALTGLPNRRLLIEQLKKALHVNARHRQQGALLFIDLDNFKTLNDTLGHDVGDILLQQVAARLMACVREIDIVARLGGDEFVVVLEDLTANELDAATRADAVGQKILAALNLPYQLAGREHRSSPSIGITLLRADNQGVDDLLKQADLAMYQAKAAGRNTLRFFDIAMQSEVDNRAALESDLRDGLQGGEELILHFQPIVSASGRVLGAEALVRWVQPQRGLVMPDEFIPLAETTGLILPLGRWVMQTACAQLVAWAKNPETEHLTLAVNVSARELHEPNFVTYVVDCLQRAGARPNRLRIELTESVLADHVDDIVVKMNALRQRGVGFSLDDFGTGYSSLSYLKRLPLDLLKIDHSFVRDVLSDPNDAAIARTIVALGHSLGLSVVAEGVETQAQRAFLAANGCYSYQGYLFGRPMPIDQFNAFAASHTSAEPVSTDR